MKYVMTNHLCVFFYEITLIRLKMCHCFFSFTYLSHDQVNFLKKFEVKKKIIYDPTEYITTSISFRFFSRKFK